MTGWAEYGLAVLLFVVAHAVPPRTTLRARLTEPSARRGYLVLYSLLCSSCSTGCWSQPGGHPMCRSGTRPAGRPGFRTW
ncbi:MAG: hypothetical protein R3D28_19300 [Geminicoccaceae bacterium]